MRLVALRTVVTSVATIALAIATPTALARFTQDPSTGGLQAVTTTAPVRANPDQQLPDTARSPAAVVSPVRANPDQQFRARGASPVAVSAPATAAASGFNWSDGAIGAGIAMTIAAIIWGCVFAVRRRSHLHHPSVITSD